MSHNYSLPVRLEEEAGRGKMNGVTKNNRRGRIDDGCAGVEEAAGKQVNNAVIYGLTSQSIMPRPGLGK